MLHPNRTPPPAPADTESGLRDTWLQLYRFVYARVQNREEAEDLAQETYARALGQAAAQPPSRPYLFTTALNLIRDRWRRSRTRGASVALDDALLLPGPQDDATQRAWIREQMARLPAEYQQVLDLRIVQGYSRAEVAQRLGKTEDSVRNLQYRALQQLRDLMCDTVKEGM